MATGSGTGTPVTGVSTSTLATLRDRVEEILTDTSNSRWSTDLIDEAIEQALDSFSTVLPYRAITTITLTAAGREIDISSITYTDIERVWWDYDASDPDHPPQYRDFEVWPGDLLFINDTDEPASGDIVRLWYAARQTLNGLNSAATTTLPARYDSIIVTGASGYAALSRAMNLTEQLNIDGWTHRRLKEWAEHQIATFERSLAQIARREATAASGIAPTGYLDRWEEQGNGWA